MAASCERGNEHSGSIQCEELLDYLRNRLVLQELSVTCGQSAIIAAILCNARAVVAALFRLLERDITR